MMKLKNLFNNEELARMILGNWKYDKNSLDMFKYCRISANAVYPFKENNQVNFLRFVPSSEKSLESIYAELEFIGYLKRSGYAPAEVIPSDNGNSLEVVRTPWGEYYAVVFRGVPGIQINKTGFDDEIVYGYGQSLGRLHSLSSIYSPRQYRRWSWKEAVEWVCAVLYDFPGQESALGEAKIIKDYLSTLPITEKTYGLVHYDFETDNVFYDASTKIYHPIDFDDSMYHWFVMDIEQVMDSLKDEHIMRCFIDGYRSRFEVSDAMLSLMPVFRRFANLYGYARILRSTAERWNNEPEWMATLRGRLDESLRMRAAGFGGDI